MQEKKFFISVWWWVRFIFLLLFKHVCHCFPQRHLGLSRGITILQNLIHLYRLIHKHTPTQKQNTNSNNNELNLHSFRHHLNNQEMATK